MYFATAHPFATGAVPLLVKSDQFRPIKIDGNPEHAYNHGSSDVFSQGSLLDLYDPDRSQHVTFDGENREWAEFAQALRDKVASIERRHRDLLPERDHHLAHAGAAVEGSAGGISQGDAGAVRPGDRRHVAGQGLQRSVRPQPAPM